MRVKVEVSFADLGEAARYLAGYCSKLYEQPVTRAAYNQEFPMGSFDSRLSGHVAEAAALELYERFCTDRGREAARKAVVREAPPTHFLCDEASFKPVGGSDG